MAVTTTLPNSASCFKCVITLRAAKLSRPLVGSSKNKMSGVAKNAAAIDKRRLSPPDKPRSSSPPGSRPPTWSVDASVKNHHVSRHSISHLSGSGWLVIRMHY
jgi:hypothetical protein